VDLEMRDETPVMTFPNMFIERSVELFILNGERENKG